MIRVPLFSGPFQGKVRVPGSKSLANRLLPLGALSGKKVVLRDVLRSEDTEVMLRALESLGVQIQKGTQVGANFSEIAIEGRKGVFLKKGNLEIHCKNSGTTLRFLTALAVLREGKTILTGNERMQQRPIADLVNALQQLGVSCEYLGKTGFPPLSVKGMGIEKNEVTLSGATSSQFVSALLMLAAFCEEPIALGIAGALVSEPYVKMTIQLLEQGGVSVEKEAGGYHIFPEDFALPTSLAVEGDATAASYPFAVAAITQGTVIVQNLYSNSLQGDIDFALEILPKMGCQSAFTESGLEVRCSLKLQPLGTCDLSHIPDAAMTAVVLAAYAKGYSRIEGLQTLRHKECDRIHALVSNLQKMGATVEEYENAITIEGDSEKLHGAEIETFDDHRVAMCFSVLGSVIPDVWIQNPECVAKTYPTYWKEFTAWASNTNR